MSRLLQSDQHSEADNKINKTADVQSELAVGESHSLQGKIAAIGDNTATNPVEMLQDPRFRTVQKHELMRQIAHQQGNRFLQKLINSRSVLHFQDSRTHPYTRLQREEGEHSGEGGESTTDEPEVNEVEVRARVREMLFDGEEGWHVVLPGSTLRGGSIQFQRGGRQRGPRLRGSYPLRPAISSMDDPVMNAARGMLIDVIRRYLSRARAPTESGQMGLHRGGYAYRARSSRGG